MRKDFIHNFSLNLSKTVLLRLFYVLASLLAATFISWISRSVSHDILYLWLVPPIVAGILFFIPGGIIVGVVSAVVGSLIYHFVYLELIDYTISLEILDSLVTIALGALSGYLSSVIRHKNWLLKQLEEGLKEKDALIEILLTANLSHEEIRKEIEIQKGELAVEKIPRFQREIDLDEGIFIVTISGRLSIDELQQTIGEAFNDTLYSTGHNILVDIRNIKYTPIFSEVQESVKLLSHIKNVISEKVALLVKGDVAYAMGWLFCRMIREMGFNIEVFLDVEEAKSWLSAG